MTALRELVAENGPMALTLGGLVIGFAFGAIVSKTNFCTMGSISDIVSFGNYRRFRAWVLAAVTALLGAQLLQYAEVVELARSMYLAPSVNWFGNMLGGHVALKVFAGFGATAVVGTAGWLGILFAPLSMGMTVALTALEFLVAFLQAFVFAVLTCIYLNDVVNLDHAH